MIKKNLNFYLVALVFFFMQMAITYGEIYRDSLFLSTYPSHWLSYFFLSVVFVNVFVFGSLTHLIHKVGTKINRFLLGSLIAIGLLCAILLQFNFYWLPFIYALYSNLLFPTLSLIAFNLASNSFSIREFKQNIATCRAVGTSGIIFAAYSTPYLLAYLDINSLLFLALAALCSIEVLLFFMPSQASMQEQAAIEKTEILNYPLLRVLLPMAIFMSLGFYFADYTFKTTLAQKLDVEEIASFLGLFIGILNLLILTFQLFLTPFLINRLGIISLFFIPPIVILLGTLASFFYPSLFVIAGYTLAVLLVYYSFYGIAFESGLSPLPLQVRLSAKSLEGLLDNIGPGIVALVFMVFAHFALSLQVQMGLLVLISFAYSLPWYFLIQKAKRLYQSALENAIRLRGFALETTTIHQLKEEEREKFVLEVLKERNTKIYPLTFSLIGDMTSLSLPTFEAVVNSLDNCDELIQEQAIASLGNKEDPHIATFLLDLLTQTKNHTLAWKIINILVPSYNTIALPYAQEALKHPLSAKQIYTLSIIFSCGGIDAIAEALKILKEAYEQTDSQILIALARILGIVHIDMLSDKLQKLIDSQDQAVVIATIESAAIQRLNHLIPSITRHLKDKHISHAASKALLSFEPSLVVPHLMPLIDIKQNFPLINLTLKTLAFLQGQVVENAIITIAKNQSALIRTTMAYWALISAPKVTRSSTYLRTIYQYIFEDAKKRKHIKLALKFPFASYVQQELRAKLHLTSLRCLYWYGCYVNPENVIKLLPLLKGIEFSAKAYSDRANATLELLNSLAQDPKLKNIISNWERETKVKKPQKIEDFKHLDPYLDKLIAYQMKENTVNDTIGKLVVLRETKLFEKLTADILYAIAEEAKWKDMAHGQILFKEGDVPNGLYIIASGVVAISAKGRLWFHLKEFEFFGEAGILDNTPRLATATAESEGLLLYIDQTTFEDIVNEFPDVLRLIVMQLITYLHDNKHP